MNNNTTIKLTGVGIDIALTSQLGPGETLEWMIEDRRCGPHAEVRFCRECNAEAFVPNGWPIQPGNVAKCKNGHVAMQVLPFAVTRRPLSKVNDDADRARTNTPHEGIT